MRKRRVLGAGSCVLRLVEHKTGYLELGQFHARSTAAAKPRQLLHQQPRPVHTITADNGTEFRAYARDRARHRRPVLFRHPKHVWEHGTNETTTAYSTSIFAKRQSMAYVTQHDCNVIA